MLACDESTSIDCAREIRGSDSSAKPVTPGLRARLDRRGVERIEQADEHRRRDLSFGSSSAVGAAHLEHDVGGKRVGGAADPRAGGVVVARPGMLASIPAPASTTIACLPLAA